MHKYDVRVTKTSDQVVVEVIAKTLADAETGALDICDAGIPELEELFTKGGLDIEVRRIS